jgi:serine/threonine protein kinase HipA of HipAB toxin-antitoxin module
MAKTRTPGTYVESVVAGRGNAYASMNGRRVHHIVYDYKPEGEGFRQDWVDELEFRLIDPETRRVLTKRETIRAIRRATPKK